LVSRYVVANALFLAAPSEIAIAIVKLARNGQFWRDVLVCPVAAIVRRI
jgi:hypothetical protein